MTDARSGASAPSAGRRLAGVIVPGLGHLARGRRGIGALLLLTWSASLAVAIGSWPRIGAIATTRSLDGIIAVATLFLLLAGSWLAAWLVGRRPAHPPGAPLDRSARTWRRFRRHRTAVAGLIVIATMYAIMLLAPLIAPFGPAEPVGPLAGARLLPPSAAYWFGTDSVGRDILSRILFGARVSLTIGFVATAISISVGTAIGAVAGYVGGRVDAMLMRFTDLVLAFPRLVLLILIVALFGPSITVLIIVLGLTQWPQVTRIVRGEVLSVREREFIQAAHALGFGSARVLLRHIVPNVLGAVIVAATLGIGNTIVLEAGLSFLGLGPPPPLATWGTMIEGGRGILIRAWWVATFPGLAIVTVVLAFNLVGDGLRDALDPRLQ